MYIRWIKRGHKNENVADITFHDAYLVESYRNEDGQPRQRTISYLGNIRQIGDELPCVERELFLLRAEKVLDTVPELTAPIRKKLIRNLHRRVPPSTHNEMLEGFRNTVRWYYDWWSKKGNPPTQKEIHDMISSASEGFSF